MRKIIFFIFLAVFYGSTCLCRAETAIKISPPVIDISLGRGGTKVFSFELINHNEKQLLEFKVFVMDLDMDKDGNTQFLEPGASKYSCSKWVELERKEALVQPGEAKKITAKLSLPGYAGPGGYYSAIVCELVNKSPAQTESGARVRWRIASLVKVSALGGVLNKKVVFDDLSLRTLFEKEEEKDKGLAFTASLRNEGNIHIQAGGRLTVLTKDRKRKGEMDFEVGTGTILPEHARDFKAVYDKFLPEGEYIARATFRYGGTSTLEKEIPFSVAVAKSGSAKEGAVTATSLKLTPEDISIKVPAGGFRTSGFSVQNRRMDKLRVEVSLGKEQGLADWFQVDPQELRLEGGSEAKVLFKVNIPQETKEGQYKAGIILSPFLVDAQGQEEKLEPQSLKITLEIPFF